MGYRASKRAANTSATSSATPSCTTSSPVATVPSNVQWLTVTYRRSVSGTGQPSRHDDGVMRSASAAVIGPTVDAKAGGSGVGLGATGDPEGVEGVLVVAGGGG